MKAIFLCDDLQNCHNVYDEFVRTELSKITSLDERIYTKADVILNPSEFVDTKIIFSTWGIPRFTEEEIKNLFPSLECVFYGAGSVQGFARPFLNLGIKVFSAWAANAVPVAEMTVAQIILSDKGYFLSNRLYHSQGKKIAGDAFKKCKGNYGETIGIIGAGMIGKLVIQMLKQYRLNVLVFDPFLSDEEAKELGVEKCTLPELFERAFVVSNHLANNEKTKGMLNYDLFCRMRENAVFINTGRGAQVVEDDLVRILSQRPDLTALLDVTCDEITLAHPFCTLKNCMLSPHIAGSAGDEVRRMGEYMLDECRAYLNKEICKYEVSTEMLERMA